VLRDTIEAELTCIPDERDCARLLALLDRRRGKLRAEARPLGKHLFEQPPRAWLRSLHPYVRAFRKPAAAQGIIPPCQ